MDNELNFETYLFINDEKLIICVIQRTTYKIIYKEQMILSDSLDELKFKSLNDFLEKNIFKVENILKNFIKNIFIILDSTEFFPIEISIKKVSKISGKQKNISRDFLKNQIFHEFLIFSRDVSKGQSRSREVKGGQGRA